MKWAWERYVYWNDVALLSRRMGWASTELLAWKTAELWWKRYQSFIP